MGSETETLVQKLRDMLETVHFAHVEDKDAVEQAADQLLLLTQQLKDANAELDSPWSGKWRIGYHTEKARADKAEAEVTRLTQQQHGKSLSQSIMVELSDVELLRSMDGVVWAQQFCRVTGFSDEAWARTWFCNAIMAGYDEASRRHSKAVEEAEARVIKLTKHLLQTLSNWNFKLYSCKECSGGKFPCPGCCIRAVCITELSALFPSQETT